MDERESTERAFMTAYQHLPANDRAALLLVDVIGFHPDEAAEVLQTPITTLRSRLRRARLTHRSGPIRRDSDGTPHAASGLIDAYVDGWEHGDPDAIADLLTEDAIFSMPPMPEVYRGRTAIHTFLSLSPCRVPWRLVPVRLEDQVAFGCYVLDGAEWTAHSVDVISIRGNRIESITAFLDPHLHRHLGLPPNLPGREDTL